MSRNQRIGLVALAVVVAVAAFLILQPEDETRNEKVGDTETTTAPETSTATKTTTTTTESAAEPERPEVKRLVVKRGKPVGGVRELSFTAGETARIEVRSDGPDELHLHGYDITRRAEPGKPARFVFKANAEGSFELESHTAEDAGLEPLVARVVVEPS